MKDTINIRLDKNHEGREVLGVYIDGVLSKWFEFDNGKELYDFVLYNQTLHWDHTVVFGEIR
jgi:hypothetical protein